MFENNTFKGKGVYLLVGLLLVLNFFLLSFFWYNQGRKPHSPLYHKGKVEEVMRERLNLSDVQFEALGEARDGLEEQLKTSKEEIGDLRKNIHKAIVQSPPDEALIQNLAAQLGQYYEQEEILLYKHYLEVYDLCDDTQKQQLPEVFLNTLGGGKEKGKGHRPPPR